jgi:hemerythrin superfamily protein
MPTPRSRAKPRSRSATRPVRRTTRPNRSARTTRKSGGKRDAIALLKSDHQEVSAFVQKYESGKDRSRDSAKKALAEKICRELTVHATIEEEILYPAIAEQVEDAVDLVEEARVEHSSVKSLIRQIQESEPGDAQYDAKVTVLGEYVKHHVKEDEGKIFPRMRKSGVDLTALGQQLAARKNTLTSE